jgi:hypothetical protein
MVRARITPDPLVIDGAGDVVAVAVVREIP